jgi:hypothetical protein
VLRQRRHVLAPLAQWRQRDRHHVEPVVQVLAEVAPGDQRRQALVGRRDDAHVGLQRRFAADALDLSLRFSRSG